MTIDEIGLALITFGLIGSLTPISLLIQRKLHGPEEGNPYITNINRIDREISRLSVIVSPILLLIGLIVVLIG